MISYKELLILSRLRNNSRKSISALSEQNNLPSSKIHLLINKLKNKNLFLRYTTLIDFSKAGFNLRVAIALKTQDKPKLLSFLLANGNINSIQRINDKYDYFIEGIFRNIFDYEIFKEKVCSYEIVKFREFHIVEEIRREGVYSG